MKLMRFCRTLGFSDVRIWDLRQLAAAIGLALAVIISSWPTAAEPALWVAERGKAKVYIFGTIHLLRPDHDWLSGRIKARFDEAQTLYLEIAEIHGTPYNVGAVIRDQGAYPRGESLVYVLGERTYRELQMKISELGGPAMALYRMRPWVANMVLNAYITSDAGASMNHGADVVFYRMARQTGKEVAGMETLEDHFLTLSGVPEEDQVRMLKQTLYDFSPAEPVYDRIVESWTAGNVQALDQVMREALKDDPEFYDRLLTDRNRKWLIRVREMLKVEGTSFIAVGAGHLAGEHSLIQMMRGAGITVRRE